MLLVSQEFFVIPSRLQLGEDKVLMAEGQNQILYLSPEYSILPLSGPHIIEASK